MAQVTSDVAFVCGGRGGRRGGRSGPFVCRGRRGLFRDGEKQILGESGHHHPYGMGWDGMLRCWLF